MQLYQVDNPLVFETYHRAYRRMAELVALPWLRGYLTIMYFEKLGWVITRADNSDMVLSTDMEFRAVDMLYDDGAACSPVEYIKRR